LVERGIVVGVRLGRLVGVCGGEGRRGIGDESLAFGSQIGVENAGNFVLGLGGAVDKL